jgi:enoyl-[acyl-carrier-protein] reductase (NADH)
VENGNGQPDQGTMVANALTGDGFVVNGVANATSFSYGPSQILYSAGSETAATTLENVVEGSVTVNETSGIPAGEVYFIVGADFEGIRS